MTGRLRRVARRVAAASAGLIGALALASPVFAQSSTWLAAPTVTNPADGNFDFNANANWNPATAPGSVTQTGTATFGTSNTNISFSAPSTTLDGLTFTAGASNYTFFTNSTTLTFNVGGLAINGGSAAFTNSGTTTSGGIVFLNTSTAANATITNNHFGFTQFGFFGGTDTPTAGNATITNSNGGSINFFASSDAGHATITNNNAGSTALSIIAFTNTSMAANATITNNNLGLIQFGQFGGTDTSSAGQAHITNNLGGETSFFANTTADHATFTNNGGTISFGGASMADHATITNTNGGGVLFINGSNAGHATISNMGTGNAQFIGASSAGSATITNTGTTIGGFPFRALTLFGQSGSTDTTTASSANITNNNLGLTLFVAKTTAGNATITNNSGGGTQFAQSGSNDTTNAGNANITNNGGTTQFFASSSAFGATITNNSGGLTQFFNTSGAGNATITNINSGSTTFNEGTTADHATITNNTLGLIQFGQSGGTDTSDAGSAHITNNSGQIQFFASSTAKNATITNNGSLSFADASSAGSAAITNGTGSLSGTILFANASTAGSATITNGNGSLTLFSDASTAGSATIMNNNGGALVFFANSNGGSARLINAAAGLVDFSGSAGPNNDNKLSLGSIEGSGVFFLGANQLTVGGNNLNTTASGVISDCGGGCLASGATGGSLVKIGTGTLTLTGINTYTGATTVNAGVLEVNGSIATSNLTTVNSGAVLTGTGSVGATQINAGGMLVPGNPAGPIGTLAVSGNLAFASGALYLVQVSGASASKTAITGTASLAGNVEIGVASRLTQQTTYTILTSAGLNNTKFGTANLLIANNFARNPVLSYVGNNVLLTLDPGSLSPMLPGNASANQVRVAGAIDNALLGGGNLTNAFGTIFNPPTGLLNGLTQISGETATGSQQTTFSAMGQFVGVMTDPMMGRGGGINGSSLAIGYAEEGASAYAAGGRTSDAFAMFTKAPSTGGASGWGFAPRWSVWASAFGGSQTTSGNAAAGSNDTTSRFAGTAVGADYLLSPSTLLGFALAGGGTNFSVANGGTGRSDLFQAGAYLFHTSGAAYVSAALAYGWQDVTTNRTVAVGGLDQLRAEFNANAWSGRLEGGYRFASPFFGGLGVTPYAAAQFVTFDLPNHAEQAIVGLNTFALSYGRRDVTDPRSEFGIRADKSWTMRDGLLTLRGRLAWAHDYDPDRAIGATFQTLPGASFVVNGAAQASDSALTTASVEMKWKNGWSAAATFEGEFSNVTQSYAGKGVVRYVW